MKSSGIIVKTMAVDGGEREREKKRKKRRGGQLKSSSWAGQLISRGDGRPSWIDRRDWPLVVYFCGVTLLQDYALIMMMLL